MPAKKCTILLTLTMATFTHLATAATFFVDSLADSGADTLRQAILDANAAPGEDAILFGSGLSGTILLASDLPTILESVSIIGPAAEAVVIDGQDMAAVLRFGGGAEMSFLVQGLTVTGGLPPAGGDGGGIAVFSGSLTLEGMRVVGNQAENNGRGGGVYGKSGTSLTINRSIIANNVSGGRGGGVYGDTVVIREAVIYGNFSDGNGGGVSCTGELSLLESTLSGNTASLQLPSVASGGGVFLIGGELTIFESTVVNNVADGGAGLQIFNSSVIEVSGSIIAGNRLPNGGESNCNTDLGQVNRRNLSGDFSCGFTGANDFSATDPRLAPLAFAGGPTPSHVPYPGSPVIDASLDEFCIEVDQRGFPRPVDGDGDMSAICDIGAVEFTPGSDEPVHYDDFESGDLAAWSLVVD